MANTASRNAYAFETVSPLIEAQGLTLKKIAKEIHVTWRLSVKHEHLIYSLGYRLIGLLFAAKKLTGHGKFIAWVENNCPFTYRYAKDLMWSGMMWDGGCRGWTAQAIEGLSKPADLLVREHLAWKVACNEETVLDLKTRLRLAEAHAAAREAAVGYQAGDAMTPTLKKALIAFDTAEKAAARRGLLEGTERDYKALRASIRKRYNALLAQAA